MNLNQLRELDCVRCARDGAPHRFREFRVGYLWFEFPVFSFFIINHRTGLGERDHRLRSVVRGNGSARITGPRGTKRAH